MFDENDVTQEWKHLFNSATTTVLATNYVAPDFWTRNSQFSVFQSQVQNDARKRGINIRRVFIYENHEEERASTKKLADQQRSHGIEVRFLPIERLDHSYYSTLISILGGIDFVLYDYNILLVTICDPKNRRIASGLLTSDRQKTDVAKDLFDKLWELADTKI